MRPFDRSDLEEIRDSIDAELAVSSRPVSFTVDTCSRVADVWQVSVREDDKTKKGLDESLEGNGAWWVDPVRGTANVLSVVPEQLTLNLRFVSPKPPAEGQTLFVYPPRYLEQLKRAWDDPEWAARGMTWLGQAVATNLYGDDFKSDPRLFEGLRRRQKEAFVLTGWNVGFLWGPPGTGKTFTLGALLATYLLDRPSHRVLLLSSTNSAVDQVLVSVDKALESLTPRHAKAAGTRRRVTRIGTNFLASAYDGREHLLPLGDLDFVRRLTELEARKPEATDIGAYASWKRTVEGIRAEMRASAKAALASASLAAMTTTSAAYRLEDLRELRPFDLVVFDEGSQVSVAYAACVAPLGRRVIVAGDPKQLAPIVQADSPAADRWLGRSLFDLQELAGPETCRLDEQSRMVDEICKVVSGTFYDGKLRVADECRHDRAWLHYRSVSDIPQLGHARASRLTVLSSGTYSQKYGGWIRYESAVAIVGLVCDLVEAHGDSAVLVLTPFRAQRALIKQKLRIAGLRSVPVTTVHRAQGSECHTVVFDPVDGAGKFVREHDRLLNVAISRAQSRLVLAASEADLANPTLRRIVDLMGFSARPTGSDSAAQLRDLATHKGFPESHIGSIVAIGSRVGRLDYVGGDLVWLTDTSTGETVKFKTGVALPGYTGGSAGKPPTAPLTTRQLNDFGGFGERAWRDAAERRLKDNEELNRQLRAASVTSATSLNGETDLPSMASPTDRGTRLPAGSTAAAVVRARVSAMANAPLRGLRKHKRPDGGGRTGAFSGIVVDCQVNGGGLIRASNGQQYAFTFVDLVPASKLKGIQVGQSIRFDATAKPGGGSIGRATNIAADE